MAFIPVDLKLAPLPQACCQKLVLDNNVFMLQVKMWLDDYKLRSGKNCTGFTFQAYSFPHGIAPCDK